VGIIPTDSLPAVVCDLENKDAVLKLYACMQLSPKKQLSVLCRSFQDISHYTMGFRPPMQAGQPDTFTVVRRMLPGPVSERARLGAWSLGGVGGASRCWRCGAAGGWLGEGGLAVVCAWPSFGIINHTTSKPLLKPTPTPTTPPTTPTPTPTPQPQPQPQPQFTLIMPASKNLPAILDPERGKKQQRKSVGVRVPDERICRDILEDFGGCLLSHSVHVETHLDAETEVPDPGVLMDLYGNSGIDFIVDTGPRVATASTVR